MYDAADRLTGRRYSDGSRVTQAYDAANRRILLNDSTGRTTSSFDAASRLSLVVNPAGKRLTYAYDGVGQRTLLRDPDGGRTAYTWDDAGRITKLINPRAERTSWSYDHASRRTVQYLANGIRASYSYDSADRLTRLANIKSDGTTISSFAYALDAVGNRTRVVEVNGDRVTWSYDNTYQLTREQRSGANAYDITHTYDAVGNQTLKTDSGSRTTYSYDSANQLVNQQDNTGRTTFSFDANGNQSLQVAPDATRTTYVWDIDNRMTRVLLPAGVRNTSAYNGDGQRVQREDTSGLAKLIWDGENILTETDSGGTTRVQVTLEPSFYGNLISQRRSSATSWHLFDAIGNTDRLTNSSAAVTDSYGYHAFGVLISSSGTSINSYQFVGRLGYYSDSDSDLMQLRRRFYAAQQQRFNSRDPIYFASKDPLLYRYVFNNVVNHVDPSGLDVCITSITVTTKGPEPHPKFALVHDIKKLGMAAGGTTFSYRFVVRVKATVSGGDTILKKATVVQRILDVTNLGVNGNAIAQWVTCKKYGKRHELKRPEEDHIWNAYRDAYLKLSVDNPNDPLWQDLSDDILIAPHERPTEDVFLNQPNEIVWEDAAGWNALRLGNNVRPSTLDPTSLDTVASLVAFRVDATGTDGVTVTARFKFHQEGVSGRKSWSAATGYPIVQPGDLDENKNGEHVWLRPKK